MEYIGIDVHKVHCQICIRLEDGGYVERRIRTATQRLTAVLGARPRARILLESSTESEWVAQCLESMGHEVVVVDPNFGPMYTNRTTRIKTDLRDARMLCDAAQRGVYRAAHRCSEDRRQLRAQLGVRTALVRTRSRYISVVRTLLRQEGYRVPSGAASSFPKRVAGVRLSSALAEAIAPMLDMMQSLNEHIAQADRALRQRVDGDVAVRRLCTLPAVGPVTATTFVATIDRVERFEKAAQVRSFLGLVPREYSSGENTRRGRITRAGSSRARALLVEVGWAIVRSKHEHLRALKEWALRVATRRGKARAVVALARRLAGILYAMWRDQLDFDPQRVGKTPVATPADCPA